MRPERREWRPRLGGDEFGVIASGIESTDAAVEVAERIATAISQPVRYKGEGLVVHASVGVARSDQTERTVEAICAAADQAMYVAKSQASVSVTLYDPARFAPQDDPGQKARLTAAIREGRIIPYYQPKYALETGRLCGFEALARWREAEDKVVLPEAFLGDIADFGLMEDMTCAFLRQVVDDIPHLSDGAEHPFRVSINISEALLASEHVCEELDWLITGNPSVTDHLAFDITERVFTARSADLIRKRLSHFSAEGVSVSMDDFGTGYGSVRHLQEFDFDELKIDRSLISRLGKDPKAEHMISGFISIAQALEVRVLAEGVETEDQADVLRRMGCGFAQGHLFGEPLPLTDAVAGYTGRAGAKVRKHSA